MPRKKPKKLDPQPYKVGYARVSTEDQSLELQLDALRKAGVKEDNLHVEKKSGVSANRPKLKLALMDCREGDELVVWKLDRLGRDPLEIYTILKHLNDKGVVVRSLTEGFDAKTPIGQLFIGISTAFAAFERALTIERTKAGIAAIKEKREKGGTWKWGRKPSLTEAQVVRAGEMLNKGMTGPKVAARYEVASPTIYQHWQRNYSNRGPKWVRRTKPK